MSDDDKKDPNSEDGKKEEASSEEKKEDEGEEEITLKKSEHDKLIEERDNYKKGLLAEKEKNKGDKTLDKKEEEEEKKEEKKEEKPKKSEFVTKADFHKANEDQAIAEITDDIPEINDNWEEIVKHVNASDRNSIKSIKQAIKDGYAVWKSREAENETEEEDDTGARSELSKDKTLGGKTKTKKDAPKKSILGVDKDHDITKWYGKK